MPPPLVHSEYVLGWLWSGSTAAFYGGGLGGRGATALMSHACSFAPTSASLPLSHTFTQKMRGSSKGGSGGGESRTASNALGGLVATCVVSMRFVTPFVLVGLGASCLETAMFALVRLALAHEYAIQGPPLPPPLFCSFLVVLLVSVCMHSPRRVFVMPSFTPGVSHVT